MRVLCSSVVNLPYIILIIWLFDVCQETLALSYQVSIYSTDFIICRGIIDV